MAGFEPALPIGMQILSLLRLPFRHTRTLFSCHRGEDDATPEGGGKSKRQNQQKLGRPSSFVRVSLRGAWLLHLSAFCVERMTARLYC